MSDSKLNNLGGASSEHGFFIRSVMANGNGWLLYSLVVPFSWSIFIRAIKDHMICYNLNWPKIKV